MTVVRTPQIWLYFQAIVVPLWNYGATHEGFVKPNLHPVYQTITAHCQCGNTFETRSTAGAISVEVCAQCHPYFTGKQRLVDTAGRIDRFRRKYASDAPTP